MEPQLINNFAAAAFCAFMCRKCEMSESVQLKFFFQQTEVITKQKTIITFVTCQIVWHLWIFFVSLPILCKPHCQTFKHHL